MYIPDRLMGSIIREVSDGGINLGFEYNLKVLISANDLIDFRW